MQTLRHRNRFPGLFAELSWLTVPRSSCRGMVGKMYAFHSGERHLISSYLLEILICMYCNVLSVLLVGCYTDMIQKMKIVPDRLYSIFFWLFNVFRYIEIRSRECEVL